MRLIRKQVVEITSGPNYLANTFLEQDARVILDRCVFFLLPTLFERMYQYMKTDEKYHGLMYD